MDKASTTKFRPQHTGMAETQHKAAQLSAGKPVTSKTMALSSTSKTKSKYSSKLFKGLKPDSDSDEVEHEERQFQRQTGQPYADQFAKIDESPSKEIRVKRLGASGMTATTANTTNEQQAQQ